MPLTPQKMWSAIVITILGSASVRGVTLTPYAVHPLPLGSIKPQGWLKGELEALATGMAGHELDFYPIVNSSRWLFPRDSNKGTDFSLENAALPYWFNAMVPLAYSLDDERLKSQVHFVADTILGMQTDDGYIGPENVTYRHTNARNTFIMGLEGMIEANKTWEDRGITAIRRYFNLTNSMLKNNGSGFTNVAPGVVAGWGTDRIHDMMMNVHWLLENYPSDQDSQLWETMQLWENLNPHPWDQWYTSPNYPKIMQGPNGYANNPMYGLMHGVNIAQGLKASAVTWRYTQNDTLLQATDMAINLTFTYHGSPSGTVLADERGHDLAPYVGSELCTVVETAFSMEYLYQLLGQNHYADRAELAIFNAYPVMMTGDAWAHQYMDQPNQPWANNITQDFNKSATEHVFTTANSGFATTYGMEPLFPCCSVNHPQGWPKFTTNSWGTVDNGLVHILLSPSTVTTNINGGDVTVDCETNYPFSNTLSYTVQAKNNFDLYVRVPEWATSNSSISVGLLKAEALQPDSKGLHKVPINPGETHIQYNLDAQIRTMPRSNNSISIYYGNLLYALEVSYNETVVLPHNHTDHTGPGNTGYPAPLHDHYYTNTSAWNIAIDPKTIQYQPMSGDLAMPVFGNVPTSMTVQGCEIDWPLHLGATADWVPLNRTCTSQPKEYKLVPYGGTKLHMSELPTVDLSKY